MDANITNGTTLLVQDPSIMDTLSGPVLEATSNIRFLFYIVTPNETTFEHLEDVPQYLTKLSPLVPLFMIPELILIYLQGKSMPRFSESVCSLICGLLMMLPAAVIGQMELNLYVWCYENMHIVELDWRSPFVWLLCLLSCDLGFYLWHRTAHEVNLIWAIHQVHHTSQDYNVTVGFRLPLLNRYIAMLFYLPCALLFPPPVFYVHYQLSYMYQFWIHSKAYPRRGLGWLDYIINNPSLHRVHHGRNRYCIDKNYGAFLSVWDIVFGTFEREKEDEEIHYGLVHSVNSFDLLYLQVHHFRDLYRRMQEYRGTGDKLSVFLKGPGWAPNLPRLGNVEDVPKIPDDITHYDKVLPSWLKIYITVHMLLAFFFFGKIKIVKMMSPSLAWLLAGYLLYNITSIGYLLEAKRLAPILEGTRCALFFLLDIALQDAFTLSPSLMYVIRAVFLISTLVWVVHLSVLGFKPKKKKVPTATLR